METLEALAARIETTGDVQSIVRTMKSLSAVSIRQYDRSIEALHDYQPTIELGLQAVLHQGRDRFGAETPSNGQTAVIVIGSDRGLCGRFNENLSDFVAGVLDQRRGGGTAGPLILTVGVRAAAGLDAVGLVSDKVLPLPGSVGGLVRSVHEILVQVDQWREREQVESVRIFCNRRSSTSYAKPVSRVLAPLSAAYLDELTRRPWPSRSLPFFSMEASALYSWLVRQHLFIGVYRAGAESLASEHAARLAAMQAAERNINTRLEDLSAEYRKMRQDMITMELMDIVAGFEAMQNP